jgi:phosphoribosylcarboxyaminoimidazole (NCAIR) mutase
MDDWLERQADALSAGANVPREELELSAHDVDVLLDVAGHAAHTSGARTNAPLLCYLLGLAHATKGLDELVEIVRSTS